MPQLTLGKAIHHIAVLLPCAMWRWLTFHSVEVKLWDVCSLQAR